MICVFAFLLDHEPAYLATSGLDGRVGPDGHSDRRRRSSQRQRLAGPEQIHRSPHPAQGFRAPAAQGAPIPRACPRLPAFHCLSRLLQECRHAPTCRRNGSCMPKLGSPHPTTGAHRRGRALAACHVYVQRRTTRSRATCYLFRGSHECFQTKVHPVSMPGQHACTNTNSASH